MNAIRLLAIGQKMPAWVNTGVEEYTKRFRLFCPFELIELPAEKRTKNADTAKIITVESEKLLQATRPTHRVIALDVKGKAWSTEELSHQLKKWEEDGRPLDFLIGGPDGLSKSLLQKVEVSWSLSPLTLPHPLARILVVEQLYRALSLLNNHPYHR